MKTNFLKTIAVTVTTALFFIVMPSCQAGKNKLRGDMVLWYDRPAEQWLDASPVGNGLMAGMVFGKTGQERIALNESSFWSGEPHDYDDPNAGSHFEYIKAQIFAGKYAETGDFIDKNFYGIPAAQQAYQPLGDLLLDFPDVDTANVSNYRRELDMETGIASVTYQSGGVTYRRETFVSYPDKVMVVRVSTDKKNCLNMQASIKTAFTDAITAGGQGELIIDGTWKNPNPEANSWNWLIAGSNGKGLRFETVLKAAAEGGTVEVSGEKIEIGGANAVTFILSAATSYVKYTDVGADPAERTAKTLAAIAGKKYEDLRQTHVKDFSSLMGRVHLTLANDRTEMQTQPINRRIIALKAGEKDITLEALVFQFGRYALASASRAGGQAANLQGIWNQDLLPPWGSKYTININIQMNYWPAEVTNLAECAQPLFDMVQDLSETGHKTAKVYYGIDKGWVTHHNTDLWRGSAPVDASRFGMWPVGGAWLALHICEHYNYSRDIEFLKKYYPVVKGSAEFLLNLLVEHPRLGYQVTPFSMSPEHGFQYMDGNVKKTGYVSPAPTMDVGILRELFPYAIQFSEILGEDAAFRTQLQEALEKLPPYKINRLGNLQEWVEDFENGPGGHNFSANFPFFPGKSIQLRRANDAPLVEATRHWMDGRRIGGGFPASWDICMWSRLERGDKTAPLITAGAKSVANNLHRDGRNNQIDATFGYTAGIAESLIQSHTGEIILLPALAETWQTGSVTGLRARGGYEVSMDWKDGKLVSAEIKNINGAESVPVRYKEKTETVRVKPGKSVKLNKF
ncbi:MAG: glycoside hydrolase family 95 protein [Dysgonamonadaceae bacterium]|jgi:alpha-L-fucosidase 2|nr:glycoside hydrolase family 95 protein [Dysgonamonadaceae bacterium]